MQKKETQNTAGLGAIGMVVVVVAIALVGLVAWRFYDASKSKSPSSTSGETASTSGSKTNTQTPPKADPYAGWLSATLMYEKLNLRYPSTWKLTNTSTPYNGNNIMAAPGNDAASLTGPTGLTVTIATGANSVGDGPYSTHPQFITPITTLGGSYYLGFGTGPAGDTYPVNGSLGTSSGSPANYPPSKNISAPDGPSYDIVGMTYNTSTQNGVSEPLRTYQNDASYNDALLIIKSLSY